MDQRHWRWVLFDSQMIGETFVPNCAIVAVQLIFSANSLIVKRALEGKSIEPLLFLSIRVIISLGCMFSVAYYQNGYKFPHVAFEWHPRLALLGLFGVVGNQVFHIYGLDLTSPTTQAIFQPSMAIWTMAICVFLKREHLNSLKLFGLLSAIGGAIIVVLFPSSASVLEDDGYVNDFNIGNGKDAESVGQDPAFFALGVFFLICNTLSYAIYLVQQKSILSVFPPTVIAFYTFFYGAIGEFILAFRYIIATDFSQFDERAWFAILYAGFFTSGLGYFLSLWAMKRTNPPLVSLASTIQPIAAAILSFFFRNEAITIAQFMGGLLIIIGLGCTVYAQSIPQKMPEVTLSQITVDSNLQQSHEKIHTTEEQTFIELKAR